MKVCTEREILVRLQHCKVTDFEAIRRALDPVLQHGATLGYPGPYLVLDGDVDSPTVSFHLCPREWNVTLEVKGQPNTRVRAIRALARHIVRLGLVKDKLRWEDFPHRIVLVDAIHNVKMGDLAALKAVLDPFLKTPGVLLEPGFLSLDGDFGVGYHWVTGFHLGLVGAMLRQGQTGESLARTLFYQGMLKEA